MDYFPILWNFLRRKVGLRTVAMISLLMAAQVNLLFSLTRVVRGLDDEQSWLTTTVFGAICLGWMIGRKRINAWSGWGLGTLSGVWLQWFYVGKLLRPLIYAINAILYLIRTMLDRTLPVEPALISLDLNLAQFTNAFNAVLIPVQLWLEGLVIGNLDYDKVVTLVLWGIGLWVIAFWSGWSLRRYSHPLMALLPVGILLAISFSYIRQKEFLVLSSFVGLVFLLMGVNSLHSRERSWNQHKVDYAEDLRLDALIAIGTVAVLLTAVAAISPIFNVQQIVDWLRSPARAAEIVQNPRADIGESLGFTIPTPVPGPFDRVLAGGLPRSHLIGSGPELEEELVMMIQVEDPAANYSPRYYWRSFTYDTYKGLGWETQDIVINHYAEGENALEPVGHSQRLIRQRVQLSENQVNFIFAAGDIATLDWPFTISWRAPLNGEERVDQFAGRVVQGKYQVDSIYPLINASQLRTADPILPDWVRTRYLSLPEGIPDRVYDVAYGLGVGQSNRFDIAVAIEHYLRAFPYTLDLPAPPTDRDIVDYFLFDLQQGYCDYYASAMVVLARASGIPARIAVGFASGTYDPANGRYVVTAADAHSWVEVYFSGVGWVPFEPTGGQPEIVRSETAPELTIDFVIPQTPFEPVWMRAARWVAWGVVVILFISLMVVLGWGFLDAWRFRNLSPDETVGILYSRLRPMGKQLSVPSQRGDTPYEFARAFTQRVVDLFSKERFFFSTEKEVNMLTEYYVLAAYAPNPLTEMERNSALKIWRNLGFRLWWASVQLRMRSRWIKKLQ